MKILYFATLLAVSLQGSDHDFQPHTVKDLKRKADTLQHILPEFAWEKEFVHNVADAYKEKAFCLGHAKIELNKKIEQEAEILETSNYKRLARRIYKKVRYRNDEDYRNSALRDCKTWYKKMSDEVNMIRLHRFYIDSGYIGNGYDVGID